MVRGGGIRLKNNNKRRKNSFGTGVFHAKVHEPTYISIGLTIDLGH